MEFILNRYRNLTVLVLVIGAQLLMLAYQVKSNQDVRLIRVWAVTAVTPLARILEVVRRNTIGIVEDYFVLINVRDENNRLREENGKLKMDNQFLRTELQTADRARALQAFQSRTPSTTLAARIIGNGTGTNSKVVFIDRGSSNGVVRGMAVVTPDGIVGKVLAAYPTASQVLLVTDPTFAAGVISEKNRVHGTLKGMGQSKCKIDYVQNEEKVDVGEMFYTSGDDRVFPKGLPVGAATVVRQGQTFKDIFLVPSGTQNGLEEVLVVIEGVHQTIPDPTTAVPSTGFKVLPAPPMTQNEQARQSMTSVLSTEADRLKDKYRKIGEAQNHVFGEGGPGSRPPNFNMNPDEVKPKPPAQPGSNAAATGAAAPPVTPRPAPNQPSTPQTAGPGATQAARPNGTPAGSQANPAVNQPRSTVPTPAQGTVQNSGATPVQRPTGVAPVGGSGTGNPANPVVNRQTPPGATQGSGATQQRPVGAAPNGVTGAGNSTNSNAGVNRQSTTAPPQRPPTTGATPSGTTQLPRPSGSAPSGTTPPQPRTTAVQEGTPDSAPRPASPKPTAPVNPQTNSADPGKGRPATARPNGEAPRAQ